MHHKQSQLNPLKCSTHTDWGIGFVSWGSPIFVGAKSSIEAPPRYRLCDARIRVKANLCALGSQKNI